MGGEQAADRGLTDSIASSHIGSVVPTREHLVEDRPLLLPGQLRRPPSAVALERWWYGRMASSHSLRHAVAFMPVRTTQSRIGVDRRPIRRRFTACRGVQGLRKAAQTGAGSGDTLHRDNQIGQGPGQVIQLQYDQDVARLQACEQAIQLRLDAVLCARLLFHDLPASGIGQHLAVCIAFGTRLVAGGEVADQHGAGPPRPTAGQGRAPRPSGIS